MTFRHLRTYSLDQLSVLVDRLCTIAEQDAKASKLRVKMNDAIIRRQNSLERRIEVLERYGR